MTDFTSKCKCFSWIEGFVAFFEKAILKVSKVKLKNSNTPKYLGTYFLCSKFRLFLKTNNILQLHYFSYLLWTHCSTYVYQKREGRKKEEEEIGFETRLSMVKHAFWAAVKRVRKTCINFQNSRMEPTTKGHSNTRPQRSLRRLNSMAKRSHYI